MYSYISLCRKIIISQNIMPYSKISTVDSVPPEKGICTICIENIENACMSLDCGHVFHPTCYNDYMMYEFTHNKKCITCPVCRKTLINVVVESPNGLDIQHNGHDEYDDNDSCSLRVKRSIVCLLNIVVFIGIVYFAKTTK